MGKLYNPFMPDVSQYGRMAFSFGGGGGGSTSTSTTGLSDWAQPIAQEAITNAVDLEAVGGLSHVQKLNAEQLDAAGRIKDQSKLGGIHESIAQDSYGAGQAYRDAASGSGLFGANALGEQAKALETTIGQAQQGVLGQQAGNFSRSGNLGGARAEAAANQAALQVGGELAANELAARRNASLQGAQGTIGAGGAIQDQFSYGVNALGQVGQVLQEQGQREGDAAYQGVQRLFGLVNSPATGTTTTQNTTGGGGK